MTNLYPMHELTCRFPTSQIPAHGDTLSIKFTEFWELDCIKETVDSYCLRYRDAKKRMATMAGTII